VQILWLIGGMGAVMLVSSLAHHAH